MSFRFFILLQCLSMTLQQDPKLNVTTLLQYHLDDTDSVSVTCQHDGWENWIVGARLLEGENRVCEVKKDKCVLSKMGNQIKFTLKNLNSEEKNLYYQCQVYRRSPIPVTTAVGEKIKLFPGFKECSCPNVPHDNMTTSGPARPCPEILGLSRPLTWALIGLVFVLCLYSLCVTAVYIKLKVKRSEEIYDTLTYVPMQVKPKKVKRYDADKNAEYMDMRKVHPQAGPIRDMNYNCRPVPTGFTM
ncbi:uncharacterized protein si:ch211-67e16.3 isoform X2 [Colossoma macropomum]|uniref:uncharacterized protein si:ch211-67e16.3 isoform X2 n=1 Tax=Colossoma macropomum TaxID=42526 RepID=UPI00186463EC|nr:uncharacterized protein si:ch211-67e16.3 isoform X2 [Colossoma macropomum]